MPGGSKVRLGGSLLCGVLRVSARACRRWAGRAAGPMSRPGWRRPLCRRHGQAPALLILDQHCRRCRPGRWSTRPTRPQPARCSREAAHQSVSSHSMPGRDSSSPGSQGLRRRPQTSGDPRPTPWQDPDVSASAANVKRWSAPAASGDDADGARIAACWRVST